MRNRFSRGAQHEVNLVSFRDLQTAVIGMLIGMLVILMLFLNPAAKSKSEEERQRGNFRIEIIWPNSMDVDIDLWCKAPGDVPVGYSNKGGLVFDLVRDDLGHYQDLTGINYEMMFSKGNPSGEYICNVHWFGNAAKVSRVPVEMIITYRTDDTNAKGSSHKMIHSKVELFHQGEELTVARWTLDKDRNIVAGSINSVQHPLREYKGPPK